MFGISVVPLNLRRQRESIPLGRRHEVCEREIWRQHTCRSSVARTHPRVVGNREPGRDPRRLQTPRPGVQARGSQKRSRPPNRRRARRPGTRLNRVRVSAPALPSASAGGAVCRSAARAAVGATGALPRRGSRDSRGRAARPATLKPECCPDLECRAQPRRTGHGAQRRGRSARAPVAARGARREASTAGPLQRDASTLRRRRPLGAAGAPRTPMASLPSLWLRRKGFSRFFTILFLTSGVTMVPAEQRESAARARASLARSHLKLRTEQEARLRKGGAARSYDVRGLRMLESRRAAAGGEAGLAPALVALPEAPLARVWRAPDAPCESLCRRRHGAAPGQ
jgi:hypothetical protein